MQKFRVQRYIYGDLQGGSRNDIVPMRDFTCASKAHDFLMDLTPKNSWEHYELVQIHAIRPWQEEV